MQPGGEGVAVFVEDETTGSGVEVIGAGVETGWLEEVQAVMNVRSASTVSSFFVA